MSTADAIITALAENADRRPKLRKLRSHLQDKLFPGALQKVFEYDLYCSKFALLGVSHQVVSCTHPYLQYDNAGDYKGYISAVKKPSEMTVTFIEDDLHAVNTMLELWDMMKYDKAKGIHYPKYLYGSTAILRYRGTLTPATVGQPEQARAMMQNKVSYQIDGFYPITRSSSTVSDGANEIMTIDVMFNVDDIAPMIASV